VGSKKNPIWRVVVADQRSPRDGRFIETIGQYNPQTEPSTIRIDAERYDHWVERGAQASNTVKQLMKAQTKSGGPTPVNAPAPAPVAVEEDEASEVVAEAAVVADAVDAPVPDDADEAADTAEPADDAAEAPEAEADASAAGEGEDEPSS
jgi:small subunit ribosomal protein S16